MSRRLPLSFQQHWLLDASRLHPQWQCAAGRAFRLAGPLDVALLRQCLEQIVQRHEALRTHIVVVDGVAFQEVRDNQECLLQASTMYGASSEEVVRNAERYVEDVCDRKLDPVTEPLWSVRLLRLNAQEHWLVFSMHRLIGDCVSIDQAFRETKALYAERLQGAPAQSKTPAQYGNYAAWQQRGAEEWEKRHEPFWTRHLAGARSVEWPHEPSSSRGQVSRLGKAQCSFGVEVSRQMQELARTFKTLPAMPMLAVYVAVLWQWCRQADFVLPFNTAGRPTEFKSAIGYFSYVLHLRLHIEGHETFKELVSRVANAFFGSMAHQDFGRLARQQPELMAGTVFQWVTWHPQETVQEQVCVREFGEGLTAVPPGATALEVTVFDTPTELRAFGSYRLDSFSASTIEKFMADLRYAAQLFADQPEARLAALDEHGGRVHGVAQRLGWELQRADIAERRGIFP